LTVGHNSPNDRRRGGSRSEARFWLLLRGVVPLLLVALLVLPGPTLAVWWVAGGAFRWRYLLIGGAISAALLVLLGLAFGWTLGRIVRGPRR